MSLKDELIQITKDSQKNLTKKRDEAKAEGISKDIETAEDVARGRIAALPKEMKKAAEEGKTQVVVSCDHDDVIGNIVLSLVNKWALQEEHLMTNIEHNVQTNVAYERNDELTISWKK